MGMNKPNLLDAALGGNAHSDVSATGKWLTLRELGARLEDATAGQVKAAILGLSLGPDDYRGEGEARKYSPDVQRAVIQALREKAIHGRRLLRST